jgi:rubrerythrin
MHMSQEEMQSAAQPAAPDALTPAELLEIRADELQDEARYRRLAAKTYGRTARTILSMARDEARHARTAGAMYELLTGKRPPAGAPVPAAAVRGVREALRAQYEPELAAAGEYGRLAARTATMQAPFAAMAGDERRHAALILSLLQ